MLDFETEISLFIERTDYRSNLANTILFENCSCFSKIPFSIWVESPRIFQCLISIPACHWVRQIDGKSSAIYLTDSFCQLYSALWSARQEHPNDLQERCAMAWTSCARLWQINFACEFSICSQYQNVEETEIYVCAQLRSLRLENECAMAKIRKKNVFRRRKNRILPLRFGSSSARTEVVHRPRSQSPLHFDIGNI